MTAVLYPKKDSWTEKNIVCRWEFVKFHLKTDFKLYCLYCSELLVFKCGWWSQYSHLSKKKWSVWVSELTPPVILVYLNSLRPSGTYMCQSDNGLPLGWHQTIIWTNAGLLLIGPLGTNFSQIVFRNSNIFIQENAFENVIWEMSAILSQPQCVKTISSSSK